jgi:hypothetical protein
VEKLTSNPKNWAMQAGDFYNQRYSKLNQITTGNVGKMQVAWTVLHRRAARPRGLAAGGRRRDVPALAVPQQGVRHRPGQPEDPLALRAEAGSRR